MKKAILVMSVMVLFAAEGRGQDSLVVVFWNLENYFDFIDGGTGESDRDFSPVGGRRWTKRKFYAKCDAIAKSFLWIGDRYHRMPDLIGVAEVENRGVLDKLIKSTLLRKYDYRIIHQDSPDRRGIDVAIMYRESSMTLLSSSSGTPSFEGKKLSTRKILHTRMLLQDGREVDFIVNHHPSKFGGEETSRGRREAAMMTLRQMCDSLGSADIISMGDFNETPDAASFSIIEGTLVNKGTAIHDKGEGSIRYEGKWELIDMFMVSKNLELRCSMEVCPIPFLMVRDRKHPGEKPLRTYTGPVYTGGVSDHCPVVLKMN